MGFTIKLDKNAERTLGMKSIGDTLVRTRSHLVPEVRKQFSEKGTKEVRKALLRDVSKGISPVAGKGKFQKYSKSYKKVIGGKGMFRTIGGKVVFFEGVRDEALLSAASPTKRASPVTMRLTGQLYNALKLSTIGGFGATFRLLFHWGDFLADIHNRRGAGKSKVVRRLLPTENNEKFNREINSEILEQLKKAAIVTARRFS